MSELTFEIVFLDVKNKSLQITLISSYINFLIIIESKILHIDGIYLYELTAI